MLLDVSGIYRPSSVRGADRDTRHIPGRLTRTPRSRKIPTVAIEFHRFGLAPISRTTERKMETRIQSEIFKNGSCSRLSNWQLMAVLVLGQSTREPQSGWRLVLSDTRTAPRHSRQQIGRVRRRRE